MTTTTSRDADLRAIVDGTAAAVADDPDQALAVFTAHGVVTYRFRAAKLGIPLEDVSVETEGALYSGSTTPSGPGSARSGSSCR
ncbi:hypothetical protein [Pseudonocardia xishanensis]|uniref:Uncharacterized protein n=1 Tax=Pseudonocardia xishanensis TaxID=630995 RepID=A0ABP8RVY8_9PSEU